MKEYVCDECGCLTVDSYFTPGTGARVECHNCGASVRPGVS
jgi:transcription initiation factor TFIIIB Brf1 subunit/transcription initiation factor TFIIB